MKKSSLFLLSMLCASAALAEPPSLPASADAQKVASALVHKQLLQPLKRAESKRSRFSRAAVAPKERRVRVLDAAALTDLHGRHFVRFAVDVRHPAGEGWQRGVLVGCAYVDQNEVFLQREGGYVPASSALGEDAEPRSDVCEITRA